MTMPLSMPVAIRKASLTSVETVVYCLAFGYSLRVGESLIFTDGDNVPRAILEHYAWLYLLAGRLFLLVAATVSLKAVWGALRASIPVVWLGAACAVTVLSVFWSVDPGITIVKSGELSLEFIMVTGLAARHGLAGFSVPIRIIGWLVLAASLFLLAAPPEFALNHGEYAGYFRGLFLHKNIFARYNVCIVITLIPSFLLNRGNARVRGDAVLALASLAMILVTQSATAILVTAVIFSLSVVMWIANRIELQKSSFVFFLPFLVTALAIAGYIERTEILDLLSRDATLTGRTAIWQTVGIAISLRPLLGYGFGSFWQSEEGAAIFVDDTWRPRHAHNGYLENTLDGGTILISLVAIITLFLLAKAMINLMRAPTPDRLFVCLTAISIPIYNLTEAAYLQEKSFPTVLVIAAVMLASQDALARTGIRNDQA